MQSSNLHWHKHGHFELQTAQVVSKRSHWFSDVLSGGRALRLLRSTAPSALCWAGLHLSGVLRSQELMAEPVTLSDGFNYDRAALEMCAPTGKYMSCALTAWATLQ